MLIGCRMEGIRLFITYCALLLPPSLAKRGPEFYNEANEDPRVCDKSVRYVAEENILPVEPGTRPSEAILRLAGRHFKRWDDGAQCFVSNLRDEYLDD